MKDFTKQKQRHRHTTGSSQQIKRRKKFMFCCNFWNKFLTTLQRRQWGNIAPNGLTGFNHFLRINLVRTYNDLAVLSDPPE